MPNDKKLHLLAGICITCIAILLCYLYYGTVNIWLGLGCGMAAGVAKEIYDYLDYGLFDKQDMLATWAGSLLGAGLVYMLLKGGVLNGF